MTRLRRCARSALQSLSVRKLPQEVPSRQVSQIKTFWQWRAVRREGSCVVCLLRLLTSVHRELVRSTNMRWKSPSKDMHKRLRHMKFLWKMHERHSITRRALSWIREMLPPKLMKRSNVGSHTFSMSSLRPTLRLKSGRVRRMCYKRRMRDYNPNMKMCCPAYQTRRG